jgi:predicted ATPase
VDNCEHLVDEVADLVRKLVEGCPQLIVVASSRERLGLRSERVFSVPPMAPTDSELLFLERARAADSGFEPDEHVAAICAAIEGLPLAIELAAARTRTLSTRAILKRLARRLGVLTSSGRDVDERQRTLEATIAWSYDLLDPDEQRAFRGLSVFAGGCTLEAAEHVADADLDLVESLLDKSLVHYRIDEAGQDRYWMLETIREYASERLAQEHEEEDARARHAEFSVRIAEQLAKAPGRGYAAEELARFEADRANFRLALLHAIEDGDAGTALRLIRFLGRVWYELSELRESYAVARAALELVGADDEDRAYALLHTAGFAGDLGEVEQAQAMLEEAESLLGGVGDLRGLALICNSRSFLDSALGSFRDAIAEAERAIELAREAGDRDLESRVKSTLATALVSLATEGDPPDRNASSAAVHCSKRLVGSGRVTPVGGGCARESGLSVPARGARRCARAFAAVGAAPAGKWAATCHEQRAQRGVHRGRARPAPDRRDARHRRQARFRAGRGDDASRRSPHARASRECCAPRDRRRRLRGGGARRRSTHSRGGDRARAQ